MRRGSAGILVAAQAQAACQSLDNGVDRYAGTDKAGVGQHHIGGFAGLVAISARGLRKGPLIR